MRDCIMDEIEVADHFYTLQGEGTYSGKPAYFLRTQGCNLRCGQPDFSEVDDMDSFEDVKSAESDDASWTCDTMTTDSGGWLSGDTYEYSDLEQEMLDEKSNLYQLLEDEQVHLVITGGEPLMRQEELTGFLDYIGAEDYFVEVETNATIKPEQEFDRFIDQYNTSPKLSNSGNPSTIRYNEEVIEWFAEQDNTYFKFVTANEKDTEEIMDEWVKEFPIDPEQVLLMPAGANQESLQERKREVAELAKEHGFQYSDRTHISIWDEMVSV